MKEPIEIQGTDLYFSRTEHEIRIIDQGTETEIARLPKNWEDVQIIAWAQGYEAGNAEGHRNGLLDGVQSVQRSLLEAMGLGVAVRAIQEDVKTLGSVLYLNGHTHREDVARIAGRE